MAGIEDFVVEGIMNDMQTVQPYQVQGGMGGRIYSDVPGGGSNLDFANRVAQNRFTNINPETGMPLGQFAEQYQRQQVEALQKRDAARTTIMQAMRGLDPQIQATILKRLGIDPGVVKSEVEQKKELMQFQQRLQQPQQEAANKLKMIGLQQQLGQGERELGLKERQFQAEAVGRGETRNIQLMRVLAMMMQANPQLQATIGPMLLQLMQASGINLAPPSTAGRQAFSPRPGVTITQEE